MFKYDNLENLKKLLKEFKYLTSDSFPMPDRTYISYDELSDKILFHDAGDIVFPFNIKIYQNIVFRKIEQKYFNFVQD